MMTLAGNEKDPDLTSPYAVYDYYVLMMQRYTYPIMLGIGLVGNTLSFIVLNTPSNRKNVMCFYLRVLAACDILALNFFLLPRWVFNVWPEYLNTQLNGTIGCIMFYFMPFIFCDASIWLVPIIALDRFIVVRFPLKASQFCTPKKAKILFGLDIFAHICLYLPSAFRQADLDKDGYYTQCNLPPALSWYQLGFEIINASVDVVFPMTLLFVLNFGIIITMRKHSADMKEKAGVEGSKHRSKQERSLTIMLVTVATSLMILLFPYTLDFIVWQTVLKDLLKYDSNMQHIRMFTFEIGFILAQLNNALNFFMYSASSPKFRKDVRILFFGKTGTFSSLSTSSSGPKSTQVYSKSQI